MHFNVWLILLNVLQLVCYLLLAGWFMHKYFDGLKKGHREPIWAFWYILLIGIPLLNGVILINGKTIWVSLAGVLAIAVGLLFVVLVIKYESDAVDEVL